MKKKKWSTVKEMLFLYLATTKILYWFNTVMQTTFGGFDNSVLQVVLSRFFTQDLLIIFAILFFFVIERFKLKTITNYALAYIAILSVVFIQMWITSRFFGPVLLEEGVAGFLAGVGYLGFFIYFTLGFFAIAIALNVKEYFKMKSKEPPETNAEDTMNDFSNALICETCKDDLREKLNLFGQFVGEWEFEGILGKGTPNEQCIPGEWIFSWILDGTAIQDVFICPSRKECEKNPNPNAEYGTTVRFYNQATDAWDMFYGLSGATHLLEGKQVGEQIIVTNKSDPDTLTQWVFSGITKNKFHWQNRTSHDNGTTWHILFELSARKR
ncbi:MAG: hypothetical protein FWE08_00880 [Oscillospiraceae bacterium]|nr:hypothetical protein [Oscillospiraceae bacterium]